MSDVVLSCEQLTKIFEDGAHKVGVLRGVDISIKAGELVSVVGSAGSGQSTLLHLLGGLDKPTSGSVNLAGKNIASLSERVRCRLRNQTLGFIYQFHHLLPEFNALENVCMPLLIRGESSKVAAERATELLETVGLQDRLTHKTGELSGGERQRVAIARAVVANPACILADEPTGNLDKRTAETVFDVLLDLQKQCRTSIVMVTHDLSLAARADRQLSLVDGVISAS
jgi:lipoprotein-releasing system ATP-binding protein